jgi:quinoprotein relay system zinc metallohydrolase 1
MHRLLARSGAVLAGAWLLSASALAADGPFAPHVPRVDTARFDLDLQARAIAPGVYVVEGSNADFSPANGCNIINTGFIVGDAGVVVINTGTHRRQGEQLRALIARTTAQPLREVLHLNLHPDYFLGNQAFADRPRRATARTQAGMAREASAYENNLYRLCGDWMKDTQALLPEAADPLDAEVAAGALRSHESTPGTDLLLAEFDGHTDSDLVVIDRRSGVAFVGGLVFTDRIPTTPHARVDAWLASLDKLEALLKREGVRTLVPSHGPVRHDLESIAQTRAYLRWIDAAFTRWAGEGREMAEVLRAPVPAPFRDWAAFKTEYVRNVAHLYPRYERAALAR